MRDESRVIALAEWAARVNAETRQVMGVSVVPEECREAQSYLDGLMSDEEAAACVAADVERVQSLGERFSTVSFAPPDDEYAGLSPTFAAACRAADEKQRRNSTVSPHIDRARRLLADEITLERAWAEVSRPGTTLHTMEGAGLAASTIMAAEYLVRENDPERLRAWLDRHSADERTAIQKHLGGKACR